MVLKLMGLQFTGRLVVLVFFVARLQFYRVMIPFCIEALICYSAFMWMFSTAQVEPPGTMENQQVEDPPPIKFTWRIENFSRLTMKKYYSDSFSVGGYKWYILLTHLQNCNLLLWVVIASCWFCWFELVGWFHQANITFSKRKQCWPLVNVFGCCWLYHVALRVE